MFGYERKEEKWEKKEDRNKPIRKNINWKEFQNKESTSSTIGGPHRMEMAISSAPDGFFTELTSRYDLRLCSPSGRYILENIYRQGENWQSSTFCLKDSAGMGPLLQIVDFSNKKGQLYVNEELIKTDQYELDEIKMKISLYSAYWISDVQLVCIYRTNGKQILQGLYTIDYEANTYKEEIFEYMEHPCRCRYRSSPPNPLFINKKAYYTILDGHNFHLIPWIPSSECNHVATIVLDRKDPILLDGDYRLLVGQECIMKEAFHVNYGSRTFFYIGERRGEDYEYEDLLPEEGYETVVSAKADRMVYIDFSKFKNIDLTRVNQCVRVFELAYFTKNSEIEDGIEPMYDYSTTDSVDSWDNDGDSERPTSLPDDLILCSRRRPLKFHGRYITYTPGGYSVHDGFIFDLETMTWANIPKEWVEDVDESVQEMFFNDKMCFSIPKEEKSRQGYNFRCAEIVLGQPPFKSLVDICRQSLIYSERIMNVPPHLFKIIFPSP